MIDTDFLQQAALFEPLVVFGAGTLIGSYLNVVALRWGTRSSVRGRSHCSRCHASLRWYELIPLVSYGLQAGRCRHCLQRISWRYPVVELITGLVYALIASVTAEYWSQLALTVVASLMIVLALIDLVQGILPDALTLGGTAFAVVVNLALGSSNVLGGTTSAFDGWQWGILVGVGTLGGLVIITKGRGMGLGDVKLGALIGASLGGSATVLALWIAFLTGAIIGIGLVVTKRARWRSTELPFGPYLAFGWLIAVSWGTPILAWYTGRY